MFKEFYQESIKGSHEGKLAQSEGNVHILNNEFFRMLRSIEDMSIGELKAYISSPLGSQENLKDKILVIVNFLDFLADLKQNSELTDLDIKEITSSSTDLENQIINSYFEYRNSNLKKIDS